MYLYNITILPPSLSRWFLVSISSGLISTILNFLLSLIFFILFFSDRSLIRYSCDQPFNVTGCDDVLRLFGAQVPDPVFPTIHSIIVLVSAVTTLLLGHLVLFHCFISKHMYNTCIIIIIIIIIILLLVYKGMTTYDYILQQRSMQSTDSSRSSCLVSISTCIIIIMYMYSIIHHFILPHTGGGVWHSICIHKEPNGSSLLALQYTSSCLLF